MKNKLLNLFFTMMKIGLFTFGGGYAMISVLESEFVDKKQWITKDEFMNMVTIAESTPGPVAINSSTYIGYKVAGIMGSLLGTIGMVLPAFIIIYIVSLFFDKFLANKYVAYAFDGIQMAIVILILKAGVNFIKGIKKYPFYYIIFSVSLLSYLIITVFDINFSTIFFILIGIVIGVMYYFINKKLSIKQKNLTDKEKK